MCGIVGIQLKNPSLCPVLGELVVPMLEGLASRGPDSTGVAVYGDEAPAGAMKYSLCAAAEDYDWAGYVAAVEARAGVRPVRCRLRGRGAVVEARLGPDRGPRLLTEIDPSVRLLGFGSAIEVYKDVGPGRASVPALRDRRDERLPGYRPHPDGDGVGSDDRALASVCRRC